MTLGTFRIKVLATQDVINCVLTYQSVYYEEKYYNRVQNEEMKSKKRRFARHEIEILK